MNYFSFDSALPKTAVKSELYHWDTKVRLFKQSKTFKNITNSNSICFFTTHDGLSFLVFSSIFDDDSNIVEPNSVTINQVFSFLVTFHYNVSYTN